MLMFIRELLADENDGVELRECLDAVSESLDW